LKTALGLVLALASTGAAALGLGQIEVKSRVGQPLLAEIAIISSDPAELEGLRAGLASPETFSRIGLQPPRGIVADLQFTPALNAAGRPVIRVTSAQAVSEPLLTFLVEVDWGQGRLVREYSALVDAPRTVSSPLQPPIQAPVIAAPNVIQRAPPVVAPVATVPTPIAPPPTAAIRATPPPPPAAREPSRPTPPAIVPPAPRPVAPTPVAAAAATQYGPIKAGESLSQIAGQLDAARGLSIEQSMIALLRANPDAFIGGNINQLKQGAVLRVPATAAMAELDAQQATALVRGQVRQWRQAQQAPLPASPAAAAPVANAAASVAASTASARRGAVARLEIVPPGASRATRTGTQSGTSAGGEGQMLRQELQQTKESLAARDAELRELKGRVADLEKLRTDQQQLLALKDNELAAAQQRLAASNQPAAVATPAPRPAVAQTAAEANPAPAPATQAQGSGLSWILGGIGLLALALLAGWLMRRKAKPAVRFRAPSTSRDDSSTSWADAFGPPPPPRTAPPDTGLLPSAALAQEAVESSLREVGAVEALSTQSTPPSAAASAVIAATAVTPDAAGPGAAAADDAATTALWNRRDRQKLPTGRTPAPEPAWHGGAGKSNGNGKAAVVAATAPASAEPSMAQRLELAQAYLDLGDRDSARQLLGEVAMTDDEDARQQASRMLRELE